ncbi:SUN domain-containing protein 3-like [Anopheles nili]|uniref:SUN domain-containing protein 3-like n=1 Tax=Anopheles nili TaxID=185578 RepID=UPI00237BA750|nr:SUN domain-containing protein 3-like [Anopheles nili]
MSEFYRRNLATFILCGLIVFLTVWHTLFIGYTPRSNIQKPIAITEHHEMERAVYIMQSEVEPHASKAGLVEEMELLNEKISLLKKINFDKLGPADYAAHKFGGEVLWVASTVPSDASVGSKIRSMISSFFDNYDRMQCIIKGCEYCYVLHSSSGSIVFKLVTSIYLSAITIEHIPQQVIPFETDVYSAIKEFSIWGMSTSKAKKVYLGTFLFDYANSFLQTMYVKSELETPSFQFIQLDIHSNYGESYTCIYRIRIHGTPAK